MSRFIGKNTKKKSTNIYIHYKLVSVRTNKNWYIYMFIPVLKNYKFQHLWAVYKILG